MAISKLEPYLGKVLVDPPAGALGTTEWIGLCHTIDLPLEFVAYLLMLPDLCEAYGRLQSGKRQTRFDPNEFLDLPVQLPAAKDIARIQKWVSDGREHIVSLREAALAERRTMDSLFGPDNLNALGGAREDPTGD